MVYNKREGIFKIILFPFVLGLKLIIGFFKTFIGFLDETAKDSEKKVKKGKSDLMDVIYFTNNGFRKCKGKIDAKLNSITPKGMENIYAYNNVYHNLDGNDSLAILYIDNPETLNFSKELEELEGERPILILEKDEKSGKLKYGIEMTKFKIKGGKRLTEVSYSFINTIYMSLLRPISDDKIRNTFIIGLLAGCLLGALVFSLIVGLLT